MAIGDVMGSAAVLEVATAKGDAKKQELKANLEKARGEYKGAMDALEKLVDSDKERGLLEQIKAALAVAKVSNNKLMELSAAGKTAEALAVYTNEARPHGR